jgi:proline iminopeptidase
MTKRTPYFILIASFLTLACPAQSLKPGEGFVRVEGGLIWYKVVGSGKKPPLLLIHGGPGSTSCSGIPGYSLLADERPIIFYDQLGSGHSDRPTDTTLWRVDRFTDEVDSLRKALHLDQLHILGHSWGGVVLLEYMARKPKGVVSAIFEGPLISTPVWIHDAEILLQGMPTALQDTINKYEALRQYEATSYIAATDSFYARHLSVSKLPRVRPADCDSVRGNDQIYNFMWGPTEFRSTGTLRDYDHEDYLRRISGPVLFIGGKYDEARPETLYRFQKLVPGSKVVITPDAGHLQIVDQPGLLTEALRAFMQSAESEY